MLGNPLVDDARVLRAAKRAGVTNFTNQDPNGLDRQIGEGGRQLSGGQRQSIPAGSRPAQRSPHSGDGRADLNMDNQSEMHVKQELARLGLKPPFILITHKTSHAGCRFPGHRRGAGEDSGGRSQRGGVAAIEGRQGAGAGDGEWLTTGSKKTPSDTVLPAPEHLEYVDDGAAAVLLTTPTRARVLLWACFLFFVSAIVWAAWAELDEVTVGQGKVIPSRQLQVIQNLEGGSSRDLRQGGDIVEKGQPLLRIDDTRFKSDFREREQELVTLRGYRPPARRNSQRGGQNEPNLGVWREQVAIDKQAIEFPEGMRMYLPNMPPVKDRCRRRG